MKYITFNNQKISKLSLGTVQFGLDYGISNNNGKPTQERVNEIVDYVYEKGINSFDTAEAYGNSEEVLGIALKDKLDTVIISKLKSELFDDALDNIEKTLLHLQKERIFGLLLHDSRLLYSWKEKYSKMVDELIKSKKIEYFGVSIYTDEDFELALSNKNIKIIQIPFNIFDQRAVTKDWFRKAKEKNKLIFIRSIFLQGLFFMKIQELRGNLIKAKIYLKKLYKLEKELGLSTSELAMAYVDSMAKESILLFGCDTLEQAKENIMNYNQLPLLEDEILDKINRVFVDIPHEITNPILWKVS